MLPASIIINTESKKGGRAKPKEFRHDEFERYFEHVGDFGRVHDLL